MVPLLTILLSCSGLASWRPYPSESNSVGFPFRAISCAAFAGAAAASWPSASFAARNADSASTLATGRAPGRPESWLARATTPTLITAGASSATTAARPQRSFATPAPIAHASAGSSVAR